MTSTTATVAAETGTRRRTNSSPALRYSLQNLRVTISRSAYVTFIVGMPLVMFVLFNQIYGKQVSDAGPVEGAWIMVNMALYGALGAAQNSGATLQLERRSGWFRQLSVAGLSGRGFLLGKLVSGAVLMLPAIAVVFVAGALTGVHLRASQWFQCAALIWVATLPMIVFGLVVALWFSAEAAAPANTILLMVFAVLGGLWFPADMFPHAMQQVAHLTPTYWIREFASWPLQHGHSPMHGLVVLGAWTLGLALLATLGFRRATRTSRR